MDDRFKFLPEGVEKISLDSLENVEPKKEINIVEVTAQNKEMLLRLRATIDSKQYDERLESEIEKYSREGEKENGGRKAFIAMEGDHPVGYVEVIAEENSLHADAPEIEGLSSRLGEFATLARIGVLLKFRGRGNNGGISVGDLLLDMADEYAKSKRKIGIRTDYLAPKTDELDHKTEDEYYAKKRGYIKDIYFSKELRNQEIDKLNAKTNKSVLYRYNKNKLHDFYLRNGYVPQGVDFVDKNKGKYRRIATKMYNSDDVHNIIS